MKYLRAIGALVILLIVGKVAMAQEVLNLKGTWNPTKGAHIEDGPSKHEQDGAVPVPGNATAHRDTSKFVFRFEGQEGRTFWGVLSSTTVSDRLIGALSVDGKRFIMTDEDGVFTGTVVDNDTLDFCYDHVTATSRAVACGLLIRQK